MIEYLRTKHIPVTSYLEATLRCNVSCAHCYVERSIPSAGQELTCEEIGEVLRDLAELGCLILVVTGGEPFLRGDILDILRKARELGFALIVFTNGTLITREHAAALHDLAPLGIEISIHGVDAATHDAITGMCGSFDRAVAAVTFLKEAGVRVKLKCAIMRGNIDNLGVLCSDYAEFAHHLGVEYRLDPIISPRRDCSQAPISLRLEADRIATVVRDLQLVLNARKGAKSRLLDPDARLCHFASNTVVISSGGDVHPCIAYKESVGNVRVERLTAIWKTSEKLRHLRSMRTRDLEECPSCKLRRFCTRCTGFAYSETGNAYGCSPFSRNLALSRRHINMASGGIR